MQCRDCQALMLEEAYGLLDAAAAAALTAHAATCEACTAARTDAVRMRGLLAQAAKMPFPHVKFTAPLAEVAAPVVKVKTQRSFNPWAIAASVLIVGGAVTAALMQDRHGPGRDVAQIDNKYTGPDGRGLVENGGNTTPPVIVKSHEWVKAAAGDTPAFKVKVTGNTALTAGVPNEYSVLAFDTTDKKSKVKFTVTLKDAKETVLFTKSFTNASIVNLPVKDAGADLLTLVVQAVDATGVTVEMIEKLPVVKK